MKLVKENIEFERGLEPKDAMNIGNPAVRLASELGLDMPELRSLWDNLEADYDSFEDFKKDNEDLYKYPSNWNIDKNSNYYEITIWAYHNPEDAFRISQLKKNDVYEIFENIEFERGLEPRNAMDIGRMKEIIEERIHKLLLLDRESNYIINNIYTNNDGSKMTFVCDYTPGEYASHKRHLKNIIIQTDLDDIINYKIMDFPNLGDYIGKFIFDTFKEYRELVKDREYHIEGADDKFIIGKK